MLSPEVTHGLDRDIQKRVSELEKRLNSETWKGSGYIPKWMASEEDLKFNRNKNFGRRRHRKRRPRRRWRIGWKSPLWFGAHGVVWAPWNPWNCFGF